MTAALALISEVENAIANGSAGRRSEMLRRVTDLFIIGSSQLSDDDIKIFDDVIKRLAAKIEISARALLATRLAPLPNAPADTVRMLAFDDAIEVAGPILFQSARLDDITLIENAKKKGQSHMLAISRRESLSEAVTDVLVELGDRQVVFSALNNLGARFSKIGFSTLVDRSDDDDELATCVGSRLEIPRHLFIALMAKASEAVRNKLEALHPHAIQQVRQAVADAASRIQAEIFAESPNHVAERVSGESSHQSAQLDERTLDSFAKAGAFGEATATLAAMCKLPAQFVEQAMTQSRSETVLILAKAVGLSWPTVKTILLLRAKRHIISPEEISQCLASFERLKPTTAQEIVRFYRTRGRTASIQPMQSRTEYKL